MMGHLYTWLKGDLLHTLYNQSCFQTCQLKMSSSLQKKDMLLSENLCKLLLSFLYRIPAVRSSDINIFSLSISRVLLFKSLVPLSAAMGSPGRLWEMQNPRLAPHLLNKNMPFNNILQRLICILNFCMYQNHLEYLLKHDSWVSLWIFDLLDLEWEKEFVFLKVFNGIHAKVLETTFWESPLWARGYCVFSLFW